MLDRIRERIRERPVLVVTLVTCLCALVTAFGLPLTPEQVGAITALTNVLVAIVVDVDRKVAAKRNADSEVP